MVSRPGSPRPSSSASHTKVEEELHEVAGIDYDKVCIKRSWFMTKYVVHDS